MAGKFADDTKIGGAVDSKEGYLRVKRDLDQMGHRAEEWQMEFDLDKYEVLHFGKLNQGRNYTLFGKVEGVLLNKETLECRFIVLGKWSR
eukprot:g46066.t1